VDEVGAGKRDFFDGDEFNHLV